MSVKNEVRYGVTNEVKYNFFYTVDTIYNNPFENYSEDEPYVKSELEREFVKIFSNKLISKKIFNRNGTPWTKCMMYLMWKFKPKKILIITSMSNYNFNIKNDVYCSYMSTDDFRDAKSFYDICIKDVTLDDDDVPFIKAAYIIDFETCFNFKRHSLNSCIDIDEASAETVPRSPQKLININPQHDPYTYIVLNDRNAFDRMFSLVQSKEKKLKERKIIVMTKEVHGTIYAGVKIAIEFNQDVCLVFNNKVFKLLVQKLPSWFFEPEETDIPLEYNYDEVKECLTLERHFNVSTYQYVCGTNTDLQDYFSDCDYVFCTYLQSFRLLRRNRVNPDVYSPISKLLVKSRQKPVYLYCEPRNVVDMMVDMCIDSSQDEIRYDVSQNDDDDDPFSDNSVEDEIRYITSQNELDENNDDPFTYDEDVEDEMIIDLDLNLEDLV